MKRQNKKNNTWLAVTLCVLFMIAGFLVVPKVLEIATSKMYKSSLKKEDIDFDNMGPEIVKNEPKEA